MIRSGRAGRMFRSAIINIAKKSQDVQEVFGLTFDPAKPLDFIQVMDKMHAKWKDTTKTVETTRAVFDIFGKRGGPAMVAMLDSWTKIKEEMGGVTNALDLAVAQHEKMLMTQQHYKQLTEVLHKETLAFVAEYFDYMKFIKGIIVSLKETMIGGRIAKQATKDNIDLMLTYKTSAETMERLVAVTAHRNKLLKSGVDETEPVIKSHNVLIEKLTEIMEIQKETEGAYDGAAEAKKQEAMTTEALARGMELANQQIKEWNIQSGKAKMTMAELTTELGNAEEGLAEARLKYAQYSALVSKGLAKMPPEVQTGLKQANSLLNKIKTAIAKLQEEQQKAADKEAEDKAKEEEKAKTIMQMRQDAHMDAQRMNAEEIANEQEKWDALEQIEMEKAELEYQRKVEKYGWLEELEEQHQANLVAIQNKYTDKAVEADEKKSKKKKDVATGEYANLANLAGRWADYEEKTGKEKQQLYMDTAQVGLQSTTEMFRMLAQENKKWFKFYQASRVAETVMAGAQGVMQAYAQGGPYIGTAFAAVITALTAMKVAMILKEKPPEYKAAGGIMSGGGVTTGMSQYIVGDNPSGKELVVPSEGIAKDSVTGAYVREKGEDTSPTIINVFTEEQFADVMSKDLPKNTMVNNMVRDSRERGASFNETRRVSGGGG
jgi:hypothetical protein